MSLDLEAIKAKWLNICGACDAGVGECTHPAQDYRPVMLELVREVDRLRAEVATGSPDDWFAGEAPTAEKPPMVGA